MENQKTVYDMSWIENVMTIIKQPLPCYTFELDEEVNGEILQSAVNRAVKLHPHFRSGFRPKGNGLYEFVRIDADPRVLACAWQEEISMDVSTEDKYPWVVCYTENKVVFTGLHLVCDGTGILNFMNDVLGFYFVEAGKLTLEALGIPDEPQSNWTEDPFLKIFRPDAAKPYTLPAFGDLIEIPESEFSEQGVQAVTFEINTADIKKYAVSSEVSQFAVITYYLMQAMQKVVKTDRGNIRSGLPINIRNMYGVSTDRNFIASASIKYVMEKMPHLPRALVETVFRSQLDLYSDQDLIRYNLSRTVIAANTRMNVLINGYMNDNPFLEPKADILFTFVNKDMIHEQLKPHIINYYVSSPRNSFPVKRTVAYANAYKDHVTLTIIHPYKSTELQDSIYEALTRDGIRFTSKETEMHAPINYIY